MKEQGRERARRRRHSAVLGIVASCVLGMLAAPAAVAQTTGGLAGYNLGATSAALEFDLNSPGLLPVGDATTGNVFSVDLPFTRSSVSSGPSIDALGSPLYPGDAAAHLGTAAVTFGAPPQFSVLNDPVLSEAQYPPTPSNKTDEHFSTPAISNGAFSEAAVSSNSHAAATGADVDATVGEISAGPAIASAASLVHIVGSKVTNSVQLGGSSVSSTATSTVTGIDIAGVIQIASVTGSAGGSSDGSSGTPSASLNIGKVSVGGQGAYIDQDGIHLVGQSGGGPLISAANTLLQNLTAQGLSVHTVAPTETTNGAATSNNSGALVVSMSGTTPTVPGLPPVAPGLPGTPGQPSVPYVVNILIGSAIASANATPFPTFPTVPTSSDFGSLPSGGGSIPSSGSTGTVSSGTGGVALAGTPASPAPTTQTLQPTGPGASAAGAKAALARVGKSVPVSLAVVVFILAIMSSGALLGYARWQLIDGRRS
jgi:hypothetical protein